jgi:hypothetical protein
MLIGPPVTPSRPRGLTRRDLLLLALLFVVSLPAVTPRVYASDEVQYFAYLRSLWFDRDVSFDNEYRYFYNRGIARTAGFEQTFLEPRTPTGLRENFGTLGSALLWAPFYGVADLTVRLRRATGATVQADGYSAPYLAAVAIGSATYAFAALALSIAAARHLTGAGLLAALAVWLGTPLLFYMYAAPAFAHAPSAFAVALFVTIWLHVRRRWSVRGLAALGAAAALMAMVREQDILYALGPALDYALALKDRVAGRASPDAPLIGWMAAPLAGMAAFLLAYTPQLLAYWSLNGRLGPSTLVTRKMTWTAPHALGVLASPEHGFFAWTPLALLAVAGLLIGGIGARGLGLRAGARGPVGTDHRSRTPDDPSPITALPSPVSDRRRIAICLVLMLMLQVYVIGSVESWTVAGAFGQRRFVSATILLVIGLAALWQALPRGLPTLAVSAMTLAAIWWNVGLMALFGAGLMDRQRLHLRQNAYDVFVTLPREGPALAHRYFTDRDSFYKVR